MLASWTLARKLFLGFGIGAVILLLVILVAYRSTDLLIKNAEMVNHTYRVQILLNELIARLIDAETGERGFIIAGDDTYLEPYQAALGPVKNDIDQLRKLTSDNPNQQRRLNSLSPFVDALLSHYREVIDLRRSGGFDAAMKQMLTNKAKLNMDQIRAIVADALQEEAELLQRRSAEAEASANWALWVVVLGGVIGILFNILVAWLITRSVTEQVGGAVTSIQSSSVELQAVAAQQATGSREQATAMTEITTTITELLASSRQIAESAQRVAQIAEQAGGGARSGLGAVDLAQEAMTGIRRQVEQIVGSMLDLGRKSQQIGTVLDIVSELAEQTNILAINATIEAVGAGESGNRFAVVADEIRKLADRVGVSAKEIRGLIDDVRSSVNTTVMATETGAKAVEAGSQQFNQVAAGFRQIADLVQTTTDAAREIELSTKQQATAVEQVNIAASSVAQATRENEAGASQTLQAATDLAHYSTDLSRVIQSERAAA